MPTLAVFIASSIDGYIADRHGSLDWLDESARPDEDYGWAEFMSTVDALAMGRGTYDHIKHLDPLPFGGRHVYVFTNRPEAPRAGVTFWAVSPAEAVERWTQAHHSKVYVDGGQLISSFLGVGMIDEMTLTTAPVILGAGAPLFHATDVSARFDLTEVRSWPSGMVNRHYRRVR